MITTSEQLDGPFGAIYRTDQTVDGKEKEKLDELHLMKIRLADFIFVINIGGYIGESTAREVAFAKSKRKQVIWLEDDKIPEQFR